LSVTFCGHIKRAEETAASMGGGQRGLDKFILWQTENRQLTTSLVTEPDLTVRQEVEPDQR
jgi:hypothetical protein